MSTTGITPASGSPIGPTTFQSLQNRAQQDFSQIAQSLQSNNLAGAQQAYADLVQLTPGGQSASAGGSNPIQSDLASLGTALQSGSVSTAQTAFSKLETDLATAAQSGTQGTGHHHHHHHGSSAPSAATPAASTDTASSSDSTSTASTSPTTVGSIFGALVKAGLSLLG
jgi:hypothetical protein